MRWLGAFVGGLVWLSVQAVAADEPSRSIMFPATAGDEVELTSLPPTGRPDPGDRCDEMAREIQALKGKPQRRFALSQKYEAECLR